MRKVLQRKSSILWAIFGWSVFFINALLLIPFDGEPFTLDASTVISLLVEVMLLSVLLFQDRFNGMIACKNTLAGTKDYHIVFGEESYTVITEVTTSTFRYELIDAHGGVAGLHHPFDEKAVSRSPWTSVPLPAGRWRNANDFLRRRPERTFRRVK